LWMHQLVSTFLYTGFFLTADPCSVGVEDHNEILPNHTL
jgi:hypothetical protein